MSQTGIPYLFMRGGTSRGPYFLRADLPQDEATLSEVLLAALGSGHRLNIDGIGGGAAVTTKVAMLSAGSDGWADVDYFFAQVQVEERLVDYRPTCGNILSGVGAAAIETGLAAAAGDLTEIRIRAVNTGARVVAAVPTRDGAPLYDGDCRIDGVPGSAAPVRLSFMDVAGSSTGALLPTGRLRDGIDGIEVTCMDVAMPMVIARAADFGLRGDESAEALDADADLLARLEAVRVKAGALMGMGDVCKSVTPKFGLLAPAQRGGTIAARYFMPWSAHPSMAVTGGQCLACCALAEGAVSDGLLERPAGSPATITLEHPSGTLEVLIDHAAGKDGFSLNSAGLVRTARKLADGMVYVPRAVWAGRSGGA